MQIQINYSEKWSTVNNTWVRGNAFIDGDHYPASQLSDRISEITDRDELDGLLDRLNGFYAIIHRIGDKTCIISDHIRSWPLYYAITDDVYISDSAEWIHQTGSERGYDPIAATEQLFTEYVTGRDTLSRDVKQLQAGELVLFDESSDAPTATAERWYKYTPGHNPTSTDLHDLERALIDSVDRFIEVANGRPILLGLSTGYDSLLIALLLHQRGYDNVITYTRYRGSEDSDEISGAKTIAEDLGFKHLSIYHTHSDYRKFYQSSAWDDFYGSVGILAKLPVPSGYITLKKIKESGKVPDDSIVVRGHHPMDLEAKLPNWTRDRQAMSKDEFLRLIWKHYARWNISSNIDNPQALRELYHARILNRSPLNLYNTTDTEPITAAVKGIESWYWQEDLPKLLLRNDMYDYFGYDRWIPLLDREYLRFLSTINYKDRVGKRIHKKYVKELNGQIRNKEKESTKGVVSTVKNRAGVAIGKVSPQLKQNFKDVLIMYRTNQSTYESDPRFGIVQKEEFDTYKLERAHPASLFFLLLYLDGYFQLEDETELDRALDETPDKQFKAPSR